MTTKIMWQTGSIAKSLLRQGAINDQDLFRPCHRSKLPKGCICVSVARLATPNPCVTIKVISPIYKKGGIQFGNGAGTYDAYDVFQVYYVIDKANPTDDRMYLSAGYYNPKTLGLTLTELERMIESIVATVRLAI